MTTRFIYTQPADESSLSREGATAQAQTSGTPTLLESGTPTAETISLQPGERALDGAYRGEDAHILAQELRQLFDAPGYSAVPVYSDATEATWEGYYTLSRLEISPWKPQAFANLQEYRGALEQTGSRRSHWRAVETSKDSKPNDFGSDQVSEIGVPALASHVRWWDGDAAESYPTPARTETTEHRDVEIYDVDAAPYSKPTLLFDLAYSEEGWADCTVWDDRGFGSREDANGDVQWARVFDPSFSPDGEFVLSNRLLRIHVDDDAQTISAERWDSTLTTPAYSSVSLGASSWAPIDVDVRGIAPARLAARILFSDGTSRYPLDCILARGDTDALFVRTPNAGSATPQGLIDLLTPIAQTTIYDAGETQALEKRTEVEQ